MADLKCPTVISDDVRECMWRNSPNGLRPERWMNISRLKIQSQSQSLLECHIGDIMLMLC